jgi:hypothetical protein
VRIHPADAGTNESSRPYHRQDLIIREDGGAWKHSEVIERSRASFAKSPERELPQDPRMKGHLARLEEVGEGGGARDAPEKVDPHRGVDEDHFRLA